MSDVTDRIREMAREVWSLADYIDGHGTTVHPLPPTLPPDLPPIPLNEQGSFVDSTGQEWVVINHITASALGRQPPVAYWAPVKPLYGASPKNG